MFFFFTTPRIVNFVSSHVISSFHHLLFMTWTWINNIIYIYILYCIYVYIYIYTVYLHAIHTYMLYIHARIHTHVRASICRICNHQQDEKNMGNMNNNGDMTSEIGRQWMVKFRIVGSDTKMSWCFWLRISFENNP